MRTHSECRAVSRLLWAAVRRELLDPERVRVEAHLQRCRRCAVEAAGYRQAARHLEAYRASAPSPPPGGWHALRAQLLAAPPPAAPFSLRAARGPALAGAGAAVALALLFRWLPLHGTVRVASLPPDPHRRTPRTFALSPTRKRSSGYPSSPSTGLRLMARGPAAPAGPAPRVQHGERTPAQPVRRRRLAGAPARLVARVRAPRPLVPDEDYLDGRDPALIRAWGGRRGRDARVMELLRRQLPPMRDDFVAIPPPLLVALDPRGALAAQALAAWQREARKVDARLARQVTLELKGTAVEEFCAAIQAQTGVRLRAGRGVGDEKVTVFVKEKPARDVMRAVARLFGYKWMRTGEEGSYRYELSQDLKSQLAEEEMRNRDIHAALLALDDRMARYQPYVEQSVDPLLARFDRAQGKEKELLHDLVKAGGWGPAQLYFRLSPAERSELMSGSTLRFSMDDSNPDRRLPAEWRTPLLKSTGLAYFPAGTIIQPEIAPDKPSTPIDQIAGAQPTVTLSLDRSEAGEFSLEVGTQALVSSEGKVSSAGGFSWKIASGRPPSMDRPDNAKENAALREDPLFRPAIALDPRPSCPRLAEAARRGRPADLDQLYSFDAEFKEPHLNTADVWEAIYRRTGIPIVADSYTHLFPLSKFRMKEAATFDTLCHAGDELGMRWKKDGDFLLCRSASYFWDKLKEVPNRLLVRWRQDSIRNGGLPLADLLEMASLTDLQLGSNTVGKGIVHCWELDEWGIIGGGPFIAGVIVPGEMRKMARALIPLTPQQLGQALSSAGLPMAACTPPQREEIGKALKHLTYGVPALEQLRLYVDYIPAGSCLWHPTVTREQYDAGAKEWPLVAAGSAAEALAAARRYDPSATEEAIHRTRGRLDFTFLGPNGEKRTTGGPDVLAPLE